jgi:uncharacterized RDD family membrane protein YckC
MNDLGPLVPDPAPSSERVPQLASLGLRFAGRLIDAIVGGLIFLGAWAVARGPDSGGGFSFGLFYVSAFGFGFLNDGVLTAATGGSIGKHVVGTRVVRLEGLQEIEAGTAIGRYLVMLILSFIPLAGLIDALWIFSGELRQTLHDKAVGTAVIRVRA